MIRSRQVAGEGRAVSQAGDEGDLAINRVSIVERAIDLLRQRIESGSWQVGDRLPPESELTGRLGISRGALREAVRALVHAGLLVTRQGDGTYVVAADETSVALNRRLIASDIGQVLEVRRGLDVEAARLASLRRTAGDLESMKSALDARRQCAIAGDQHGFAREDAAYHLAVAAAAHNQLLLELYESVLLAIRQSVDSPAAVTHAARYGVDDHHSLFDAIRDGDTERAVTAAGWILDGQLSGITEAARIGNPTESS